MVGPAWKRHASDSRLFGLRRKVISGLWTDRIHELSQMCSMNISRCLLMCKIVSMRLNLKWTEKKNSGYFEHALVEIAHDSTLKRH